MINRNESLIVLSGAHRTGKTSVMQCFVERNPGVQVVPFSTTKCYREFFGPDKPFSMDLPPKERVGFQDFVLGNWLIAVGNCTAQGGTWIIDRGPLDFAAYLMLGLVECTDERINREAVALVQECLARNYKVVKFQLLFLPVLQKIMGKMPPDDTTKLTGKISLINQQVFTAVLCDLSQQSTYMSVMAGYSLAKLSKTSTIPSSEKSIEKRTMWLEKYTNVRAGEVV